MQTPQASADAAPMLRLLVVINQRETLIFRSEEKGSVAEHIYPYDPNGELKQLKRIIGADAASMSSENMAYYKQISRVLSEADEILLMGNGTGSSSAMSHFKDYLETHHADVAARILGALTVDVEAMSERQLLQAARAFYLHHAGLEI